MKPMPRRQLLRRSLIIGSFILFPVTIMYFSPVLIVLGAMKGILSGSAVAFATLFLSALVLGRAMCGWVCPAAGLQEACFAAQPKRVNGKKYDWIKYLFWVPWMGGITYLLIVNGVRSADFLFMMESPISLSSPTQYPVYLIVTGLIFVLSLSVGKRGFCHTVCWMAPFMIMGTLLQKQLRLPALHLRAIPEKCVECEHCTTECPMSLEVTGMVKRGEMTNAECILCGNCVDICKSDAIRYVFGALERKIN
jgi:ferredoxin-type protein NapH